MLVPKNNDTVLFSNLNNAAGCALRTNPLQMSQL